MVSVSSVVTTVGGTMMKKIIELGLVTEITDNGKAVIRPYPSAMKYISNEDPIIIYTKGDGNIYAAKLHEDNGEADEEMDQDIGLVVRVNEGFAINIKRIGKQGTIQVTVTSQSSFERE